MLWTSAIPLRTMRYSESGTGRISIQPVQTCNQKFIAATLRSLRSFATRISCSATCFWIHKLPQEIAKIAKRNTDFHDNGPRCRKDQGACHFARESGNDSCVLNAPATRSTSARACRYPHFFSEFCKNTEFSIVGVVWFENYKATRQPHRPHPGFTPGEPGFGNYNGKHYGASSPPGFMPGVRRFENSHSQVVKPGLYRRKAGRGRVACGGVCSCQTAALPTRGRQGPNRRGIRLQPISA